MWLLQEGCVFLQRFGAPVAHVVAPNVLGAALALYLQGDEKHM